MVSVSSNQSAAIFEDVKPSTAQKLELIIDTVKAHTRRFQLTKSSQAWNIAPNIPRSSPTACHYLNFENTNPISNPNPDPTLTSNLYLLYFYV